MRICYLVAETDDVSFGIYACSPGESSFCAVFSDMENGLCLWAAETLMAGRADYGIYE